MTTDAMRLLLYSTQPHPCSYLADQEAITAFVDPNVEADNDIYNQLIQLGFRRSGEHIYMPYCRQCKACLSSRVIVDQFQYSRSFKRICKRNKHLTQAIVEQHHIDRDEHFELYQAYINQRHKDGDMYPAHREQFDKFLFANWCEVRFIEFRDQGKLVAAAVTDILDDGLSALYTYFDPEQPQNSLGTYAILQQIAYAQEYNFPFVYLGYYVKNSPKMQYKINFKPLQLFIDRRWQDLIEIEELNTDP